MIPLAFSRPTDWRTGYADDKLVTRVKGFQPLSDWKRIASPPWRGAAIMTSVSAPEALRVLSWVSTVGSCDVTGWRSITLMFVPSIALSKAFMKVWPVSVFRYRKATFASGLLI